MHVLDLSTGGTVYAFEADRPRIVASNNKLFTSSAALVRLGPGYLLETALLARGSVADGVLDGDLAVVGGGDPHLQAPHRRRLAGTVACLRAGPCGRRGSGA
ncbi:MAG: D-alanyl-D-alanine carboxypeptidase [Thermoanaerobaculia bacterium]